MLNVSLFLGSDPTVFAYSMYSSQIIINLRQHQEAKSRSILLTMDLSLVVKRFVGFFVFYLPIAFKAVPVIGYYILGNKY